MSCPSFILLLAYVICIVSEGNTLWNHWKYCEWISYKMNHTKYYEIIWFKNINRVYKKYYLDYNYNLNSNNLRLINFFERFLKTSPRNAWKIMESYLWKCNWVWHLVIYHWNKTFFKYSSSLWIIYNNICINHINILPVNKW